MIHRYKVTIGSNGSLKVSVEPAETQAMRKLADELRDLYHEFGRLGNEISRGTRHLTTSQLAL